MDRRLPLAVGLLIAATAVGCQNFGWPRLRSPGPATYRQNNALRFDPYPQNDTAPMLEGVRPPSYDQPPVESTRGRWFQWGKP